MFALMLPRDRDIAGSARGHLRAATSDLHAALDARLAPLVGRGDAAYGKFLLVSATALLPIEQALREANIERVLPDWPQRARSEALRLDLDDLSLPEPLAPAVPEVDGEAFQLGM